jgi:uncharacterized circularly permuted ATP-grasp superfamily protein/uncharacterized alpha-E superfamily protein
MIADLLQFSLRDPNVYDEVSADGVHPRPHWRGLIDSLHSLGDKEFSNRWQSAQQRIRENGVTYNIYGDPQGASRPWAIDLIPFVISGAEWASIEAGIIQRAQLLELILSDLYGEQKLLLDGRLPAALLFANPAFLRPLARLGLARQNHLHLLGVDLARSPDGAWWVLADRTQSPSGAGYALENRTIVSDVLPDLFRASDVRRLPPFFEALRESLIRLAHSDNPRVALLTPGPLNETYFEHSYLARYLGFTLVEGADLAVRDQRLFLKTVEGLQQLDVLLRRVDDGFCDPLELRADSFLGVPGLVEAVAAGNVRVANALGSGVIETAAIMPFLPGLARHLLGEQLKLPSVATWWCGQDYALDQVLERLDRLVVKPAFPSRPMEPVFGGQLAASEKQRLQQQLRARPYDYVAQEEVALSTAPVWDRGHIYPRSLVLRTYVLNAGDKWIAMPGGLVRVAGSDGPVVSMQRGGHSKDAWVLGDHLLNSARSQRPDDQPFELRRAAPDLPSRVADNLFWLGRYAERAENIVRLLRTLIHQVRRANDSELHGLLRLHACLDSQVSKSGAARPLNASELERDLISLMSDAKRANSLAATIGDIQRIGGAVRERLSSDMTRLIGQLIESVRVEPYMLFSEHSAVLNGCLELFSAFSGLERENITRGAGWLFLSLGRRLERAIGSARQLREVTDYMGDLDRPLLNYLLEVADSSITYRSRYYTTLHPAAVLDVLMRDGTNPRSLDFQLAHVADLYSKLPRHDPAELRSATNALTLLRSFNLDHLDFSTAESNNDGNPPERTRLKRMLQDLLEFLPSWSNNLTNIYFSHARTLPVSIGE